jgi:PleD family two-component response regulator
MRKKILIVDDDAAVRLYIESLLNENHDVILKEDGQEAINWLNEGNQVDLILLDMEMPNVNGRVFIRKVKYSFTHKDIPVIVISSTDSKLIKNSFFKLGAYDYILKPFKGDDFKKRVEKVIMQDSH